MAARQGLGFPVQQAAITPAHSPKDVPLSPESQQHLQLGVQRLQAQRQARQQGPQSSGSFCQPGTGMEWGGSDPAAWAAQPSRSFCSGQQLAHAERAGDAANFLGMGRGQTGMQAACASVLQQPSLTSDWQELLWTALLRDCRGNSSQPMLNWSPSCAAEHPSVLTLEHANKAGVPGAALQQVQEELDALHLRLQVSLQPRCMSCRLLCAVLKSASVLGSSRSLVQQGTKAIARPSHVAKQCSPVAPPVLQAVQQRRTLRPVECRPATGVRVLRAIQPGCSTQGQAVEPEVRLQCDGGPATQDLNGKSDLKLTRLRGPMLLQAHMRLLHEKCGQR